MNDLTLKEAEESFDLAIYALTEITKIMASKPTCFIKLYKRKSPLVLKFLFLWRDTYAEVRGFKYDDE